MGAGPSKEQVYRFVYRELKKIQRELAEKGVQSTYKNRQLRGGDAEKGFCIYFHRSNASNGECFLFPQAETKIDGVWTQYSRPSWMGPSYEKEGKAAILEYFAA